ncbi:MAG: YitT family protein [Desulfobulbaceae bacterium]|nr:YitT family protein [Desulfobulbaceae bacterium]
MIAQPLPSPRDRALDILWNLLLIAAGSMLTGLSINGILIPKGFVSGGVTGIALIIHHLLPEITFGAIYLLINIPLYILAYKNVGRRFFIYSVVGVCAFSAAVSLVHIPVHLDDKILAALLAGILFGAGSGIILRSYGSAGGVDILSVWLLKRFSISLGNTILAINVLVVVMIGCLYPLEVVLYAAIFQFVATRVVNLVVTGLSQRKAVFIISPQWQEISQVILSDIRRGVTVLEGKGGYSGQQEHILYAVITFREIGVLKRAIQQIDPNAFVVVSDTMEVMNYRIGNQPHW